MDINDLLARVETAVITDVDAQAYAVTTYGIQFGVRENIDMRNPPGEDECPLVVVYPGGKQTGLNNSKKFYVLNIELLVHDGDTSETDSGVVLFTGGRRVEALRQYVFDAVKSAVPNDCQIENINVEYDTIGQYPFVWCGMQIDITQEKLIGQDPYE